jgi:rare lipoprotein A
MVNKRNNDMKFRNTLFLAIFSASIFSGCATNNKILTLPNCTIEQNTPTHTKKIAKKQKSKINFKEIGIASYYGPKWHGRTTANGEKLNLNELTAAHKSLPFNSIVKVTDLDTGNSIFVRINDRGPYIRGRIIDLTDSAAKKLGILHKGIARVKIEVVS